MTIAPLSKRYRRTGKGGKNPQEGRKDPLYVYIQPRCMSVVAFVFLIEPGNVAGLIGDTKYFS
ncbi:hypothetical protein CN582_05270 [Bacillus wiedmannii]|uniref:hypothetical protein n=1 Tax=Bacillus pretiosus TaxID=2983392 RepID=UPI000BF50210|nr:hypothetical protein CN582_05270 [Bacillus wiedmannii]PFY73007.1 hypothetical protein COL61_11430 [Bacillus wiedmannii]PHF96565.1 hypothetical protein COI45_03415 [Bacillus wiedmannii]